VHSDTLWDSIALLLKRKPWTLFFLPFWLLKGRAYFKACVRRLVSPDVTLFPYREELVDWIKQEHTDGRRVILATAAHGKIAARVARHLGCCDAVLASDETVNLKGKEKLEAIRRHSGGSAFSYAGDSKCDMPIWDAAETVVLAGSGTRFRERFQAEGKLEKVFENKTGKWRVLTRAVRPHQWVKNTLVFLPLLVAHEWQNVVVLRDTLVLFAAFSCMASSVYLLNDLLDLEHDRAHREKRFRGFAAGVLSIPLGIVVGALFFLVGSLATLLLIPQAAPWLLFYWMLTFTYSFYLKQQALVDVFTLSLLYSIRAVAGAVFLTEGLSEWMIAFLIFFFLSLALVKRFSELRSLDKEKAEKIHGRGYIAEDIAPVGIFGVASAFTSVLVVGLYITNEAGKRLYGKPEFLWLLSLAMLFWLCRTWLLAWRGRIHQDPVIWALRDKFSWGLGAVCAILLLLAAK
jgi:4-hydroxybenzoate polyprenyltransferase/phosphoserine phosphatase